MATGNDEYELAKHLLQRLRAGWLPHHVGTDPGSWWWGRPRSGDGFFSWSSGWTPSMSVVEPMTDDEVRVWGESLHPMAPEAAHIGEPAGVESDVMEQPALADHGFAWIGQPWSSCEECGRPASEHPGMDMLRPGSSPFDLSESAREVVPWEEAAKRIPLARAYGLLEAVHNA